MTPPIQNDRIKTLPILNPPETSAHTSPTADTSSETKSPSFQRENPQAELSQVVDQAGAHRPTRPRADPPIVMGSLHISANGRSYDVSAASVGRNVPPRALQNLMRSGLTCSFHEGNRTIYYRPVPGAIQDMHNVRSGLGRADFHAMVANR